MATRRSIVMGAGLSAVSTPVIGRPATPGLAAGLEPAQVAADLARYESFGGKASGGAGDTACGEWMEGELRRLGFQTTRQRFQAPFFEPAKVSLAFEGGEASDIIVQAPVALTPGEGLEAALAPLDPWSQEPLNGAIAVVRLPHRRWSTSRAPEVRRAIERAVAHGAGALVLVTDGPTRQALALNAGADDAARLPLIGVGMADGERLQAAAARGVRARLIVQGQAGRREAFNLIGGLERGAERRLVVSTPRSGWFGCMGERGGGIAIWLGLARWAAQSARLDLTFVATSGHEYENLGGHAFLASDLAPPREASTLWTHLGAAVAARDWHEAGERLSPLPSVDPQRFLVARRDLVEPLRQACRGQAGLEAVYDDAAGAGGELGEIFAAGYLRAFGVFGAHRFHHARNDDMRCVDAEHVAAAGQTLLAAIRALTT